jgi:hypothetical protein
MLDTDVCGFFHPIGGGDYVELWKKYVGKVSDKQVVQKSVDEEPISPFIAYDDGYFWPDLWSEIDEMFESTILLFPLAALRRRARAGEFDAPTTEKILTMPLSHVQVWEVITANKAALTKDLSPKSLEAAVARSHLSRTTFITVDDEFEQDEFVYSVELCPVRKRITVCFRGSSTKMDWATDFQLYMKEVANPMRAHRGQDETIRVHNGFYNYLLEPNLRDRKGPNAELLSGFKKIMSRHILPLFQAHPPGFKLYVTGHSMGAALAILFAFYAAAEPDAVIAKPVSVFSIGGPYVGDQSFRSAHQLLESLGKLRHVRLTNHDDLVPLMPRMSYQLPFRPESHFGARFKHVGVDLRLYAGSTPVDISYPRVRTGFFSSAFDELVRTWDQSLLSNIMWNPLNYRTMPYHNIKLYMERVDANKPILETLQLNTIYSRKDIVGNLVAEC